MLLQISSEVSRSQQRMLLRKNGRFDEKYLFEDGVILSWHHSFCYVGMEKNGQGLFFVQGEVAVELLESISEKGPRAIRIIMGI